MRATLLALLLTACTHVTSRQVGTAEGFPVYRITCSGRLDDCYDKAAQVCPGGFVPMGDREGTGSGYLTRVDGELLVRCQ